MAVLISSSLKGQTTEGYDAVLEQVQESIMSASGFIVHFSHPGQAEWRVYEVWETKSQADKWFVANIVPLLPPGIHPKRTYQLLHSLLQPLAASTTG